MVMARKPRIEYNGAVYHVISRGNRGNAVFKTDRDRVSFLETLAETCEKTGWLIHAYVLMPNHYHLLLDTPEPNLVTGMKWCLGTYTQRYNLRNNLNGHVFQGRYKAIVVDTENVGYFTTVSSYIHLNPLRANLIDITNQTLDAFPWSSYPFYLSSLNRPWWLHVERTLGGFGVANDSRGRQWYQAYMQKRVKGFLKSEEQKSHMLKEWERIRSGWYYGDESFRDQLLSTMNEKIDAMKPETYSGKPKQEHHIYAAEQMLEKGLRRLKIQRDALEGMKKSHTSKQVLAWLLRSRTSVSAEWVAKSLYMGHRVNVSKAVYKMKQNQDPVVEKLKEKVLKSTH